MATMTLEELVSQLQKGYGRDLRAVVLYGSAAAAGEHVPKRSDYNVLVIVDALPVERLKAVAATARAWAEAGNPAPLTLTADEWRSSADIFPMEYADILERHRVLYGTPPFDGIQVAPADLRLQLEYEAMGALLHLRQAILAAGGDGRRLLALVEGSLGTVMAIFRAVLRLHGARPSGDRVAVIGEVASRTGIDGAPFVAIARHLRGEQRIAKGEVEGVVARYVGEVKGLVAYLDRYQG